MFQAPFYFSFSLYQVVCVVGCGGVGWGDVKLVVVALITNYIYTLPNMFCTNVEYFRVSTLILALSTLHTSYL